MFSSSKPATANAARSSALQSAREASVVRGLNLRRGSPARAESPGAHPQGSATDRLGTAIVSVATLALAAGATAMVARIWASLAMIR